MKVLDAHHHHGNILEVLGGSVPEAQMRREEWERKEISLRLATMDANGIDQAVMMPSSAYLKPEGVKDTQRINDGIAAYRAKNPERFPVALGTVEPQHGERSLPEIDRIKYELGMQGVVWHHHFQGAFLDNYWMRPYLKRLSEIGLAPFIHTYAESWMEAPWRLQILAQEFPETTFVALDAFSSFAQTKQYFPIARSTPNILFETGMVHLWRDLEEFILEFGADKVVFGTDTYSYPFFREVERNQTIERIRSGPFSDEDKAKMLGGNLRKLFGIKE